MSIRRKRGQSQLTRWQKRKAEKRNARPETLGRIPKPKGVRNGFEKAFSGICPPSRWS